MIPLVGYLDRVSGRSGERIGVKVSSQSGERYTADFVRIVHAVPNPAGPGMKFEPIPCGFAGDDASCPGSCGVVDAKLDLPEGGTIQVRVQPGLLDAAQPVLALGLMVLLVRRRESY